MCIKKLWIAVLLGMVLVAGLAGEVGARDRAAVSARKYVTIPAGHFSPNQDGSDWYNNGDYITLGSGSSGSFIAPVVFPGSGPVTVKKLILYAYDTSGTVDISVGLYKTNPSADTKAQMAMANSDGAVPAVREFSDTSITYATIQRSHGVYLRLALGAPALHKVYGVKIAYTD